jgi:hypothetical protein
MVPETTKNLPSKGHLPANMDFVSVPPRLDHLGELFFQTLRGDTEFPKDTLWHSIYYSPPRPCSTLISESSMLSNVVKLEENIV